MTYSDFTEKVHIIPETPPGFLTPFYSKYMKEAENLMSHHSRKILRLNLIEGCSRARNSAMDVSFFYTIVYKTSQRFAEN